MHAVMERETLTADTNWTALAACKDADLRRFFPDRPGQAASATIRQFCVGCPVVRECQDDATQGARRTHGVWGREFHAPSGHVWTLEALEAKYGAPRSDDEPRPRQGLCRDCGVLRSVRSDGAVRLHWIPAAGGGQTRCMGSGYAPREAS